MPATRRSRRRSLCLAAALVAAGGSAVAAHAAAPVGPAAPAAAGSAAVTGVAAGDVRVEGRVLDATTLEPIAGAVVYVGDWRALCDKDGRFFLMLPPGRWNVEAAARRYLSASSPVDACAGCGPDLEILLPPAHHVEEHVTVSASANGGSDLAATTPVRPTEVLNAAGAFENVFRVLQLLPGVSGTGDVSSRLSVRGGGPDQNMTVMDGVEVHDPYRLYGLVSAFNPETVEGFELSTGAFSARYGDRLSSILTVDTRRGTSSTLATGSVGLSLTDGNAIVEGRLPGQAGSWLLAARRTWYDLVAERFTDDDLPSFDDLQAKLVLDLGSGRSLTLGGLRSRERADIAFDDDFEKGLFDTKTKNDLGSIGLLLPLGTWGSWRTVAALYDSTDAFDLSGEFRNEGRRSNAPYDDVGFGFDAVTASLDRRVRDRSLRQELTFRPLASHVASAGFELHDLETRERLHVELPGRPDEGLRRMVYSYDAAPTHLRYGAWLLDRFPVSSAVDLELGLRFDESRLNRKGELTPRVSLGVRPAPGTRLRAAFGLHTQSPGYEKLRQADYVLDLAHDGPRSLENEKALHAILGVERDLAEGVSVRAEGFYKRFRDLIVGRQETEREVSERLALYDYPPALAGSIPRHAMITDEPENGARGRAYGFDVFLTKRAASSSTRLSGWLAYTHTSANRRAYGRTYPFEYEQPHALNLVANVRVNQRLELSFTSRLASGFPRTKPLGVSVSGLLDLDDADGDGRTIEVIPERDPEGRYVYAVDYGSIENLNGSRHPWYGRLDFRATFVPRWGKGRWRFYVDAINTFGRNNGFLVDELEHDPSSDRPRLVTKREGGFPFLPSFGIHARF
jgi:hypothetical protein